MVATSFWQGAAEYLSGSKSPGNNLIFIAVGVLLALFWLSLYLWDRCGSRVPRGAFRAKPLFDELCQAHRLGRADRELLVRLADSRQVAEPALLFVNPVLLHDPANADAPLAPDVEKLLKRLYGEAASHPGGTTLS